MHEYSIDVDHNKIIYYLAIVAVSITGLLTSAINKWGEYFPFNEFTVSITALSLFVILYKLFDKTFWKYKWLRKLGIVHTPNLNGTWKGNFISSFDDWKEERPASILIEQSWSEICIIGKFNDSSSNSYTTSIKVRNGGGIKLFYSYQNDKKPERANSPFSDHKGYASFVLNKEENVLQGQYFNNPSNNRNHGTIRLERIG